MSKTIKAACLVLVLGFVGCDKTSETYNSMAGHPSLKSLTLVEKLNWENAWRAKVVSGGKQPVISHLNSYDSYCQLPDRLELKRVGDNYSAKIHLDIETYECFYDRVFCPAGSRYPSGHCNDTDTREYKARMAARKSFVSGRFDNVVFKEREIKEASPSMAHGIAIMGRGIMFSNEGRVPETSTYGTYEYKK